MTRPWMTALAAASVLAGLGMPRPAAAQQPEIATTVAFTEGPAVDRQGNVYFTDIINQRIMKLGADGVLSTYRESSNAANGLLIDPQGRLIACEGAAFERPGVKVKGKPQVTRTDLKTGKIEVLADSYEGKPLHGPERRDHRRQGPAVLHRSGWCRRLPDRRAGQAGAHPRGAGYPASQRHSDLPGRQEAVSDRSQPGARRRAHDSLLRPAARRDRPQHAGPLQLLAGPQRRWHEHRHAGQPVRVGRHEPAPRHVGDPRQQGRRLRHLAGGQAAQVHSRSRKTSSRTTRSAART